MSSDNDRWLTDGNCKMCRRNKYCSKLCSASKRRLQRNVHNAVNKATGGMLDIMSERLARTYR